MAKQKKHPKSTNKQMKKMSNVRWVQRAKDKGMKSTKDGKTHYMAYSKAGDKHIVYPTVREVDGKLKQLSSEEAIKAAYKNKDALVYNKEKKALKASIYGYKKAGSFDKETKKQAKKDWKSIKKETIVKSKNKNEMITSNNGGPKKNAKKARKALMENPEAREIVEKNPGKFKKSGKGRKIKVVGRSSEGKRIVNKTRFGLKQGDPGTKEVDTGRFRDEVTEKPVTTTVKGQPTTTEKTYIKRQGAFTEDKSYDTGKHKKASDQKKTANKYLGMSDDEINTSAQSGNRGAQLEQALRKGANENKEVITYKGKKYAVGKLSKKTVTTPGKDTQVTKMVKETKKVPIKETVSTPGKISITSTTKKTGKGIRYPGEFNIGVYGQKNKRATGDDRRGLFSKKRK